ncbi:putative cytochrome P450 [Eremomyces bilateralis CBS 781.70]|uniref:Cytochrome P450 n=1 Tax=Eremomyces bilateralis CBS 781.70 TaxID=1392243 RepID=A0A6G1G857_9PEZI|nr:putative cytochrome P450 [Eremomyces bilateralis CBS 781.70]KAF1814248.1 putative cytochrome P450 [Eremomyces bilateralis CBS 781.70]
MEKLGVPGSVLSGNAHVNTCRRLDIEPQKGCPGGAKGSFPENRKSDFHIDPSNNPAVLHAQFDHLRSTCPLAFTLDKGGFWLLTRYADIKASAADHNTFISSVKAVVPSDPRGTRRPPLNYDPPNHTPYRTALDRTLRPQRLERLRPLLEKHAEEELEKLLQRGGGDICTEFGANYAAWVETEWLNLDHASAPVLAETAARWVNAWRQEDAENVMKYSTRLYDIARALFADRKDNPRDTASDPATSLLAEQDEKGEPLKEEHLIGALRQSLVVGMVAPPLMLGGICNHLSEDQELQQRLREEPGLIGPAVEEFIRLYVPYRGFSRTVSSKVEIHGRIIRPGQPVTMTYAAGNRDPQVFPRPHEFVLDRPNISSHLGFGRGRHRCAGAPLARMALQIAVSVILKRTERFEVNGPLQFVRMPEMGIMSCPLRLIPSMAV